MQKTTSQYSKTFQATTGWDFESIKYLQILRNEGKISHDELRKIHKIFNKARYYIDHTFNIPSKEFQQYVFRKVIPDMNTYIDKFTFEHPDIKSLLKNIVVTYKRVRDEKAK